MTLDNFFKELDILFNTNTSTDKILLFMDQTADKFQNDPLSFCSVMNEKGGLLRDLSRYDEALGCYEKGINNLNLLNMTSSPEYATVLVNKGNTLRLKKCFDDSLNVLNEADNIFKNTIEKTDYRYLALLNTYSLLFSDMKDYKKSIFYMEQTIDGIEISNNFSALAVTYANLAGLYDQINENVKFDLYFNKSYDIYSNKFNKKIPSFAGLLNTGGIHYYKTKNYEKAIKFFKESLELSNSFFGKNLYYAITCENLSEIYLEQKDYENYKSIINEAIEIYKVIRNDDLDVKRLLLKLEDIKQ